jgi:antitoxin (DNA-binding transcriptional repressor) of toxin-antitoxin stability system
LERGETIVITRHGRVIARLLQEADGRRANVAEVIAELRAFRRSLPPISREELLASRHAGHKY